MPEQFDPRWEYWEPDPEVAEAMGGVVVPDLDVYHAGWRVFGRVSGRSCRVCGRPFESNRSQQVYCSRVCHWRARDISDRVRRQKGKPVKATPTFLVGQRVRIEAPADPHVHGCEGVVEKIEEWGVHLAVVRAVRPTDQPHHKPRWRAFYSEVVPLSVPQVADEPCRICGCQRFVRAGKCLVCCECGESSGGCS
jgi:hypothetical protein